MNDKTANKKLEIAFRREGARLYVNANLDGNDMPLCDGKEALEWCSDSLTLEHPKGGHITVQAIVTETKPCVNVHASHSTPYKPEHELQNGKTLTFVMEVDGLGFRSSWHD